MPIKKNIVWFEEVVKEDVGLVGGKGANLGEMTNANLPVPYGFIITSKAYFDFIEQVGIAKRLKEFTSFINYENSSELEQASSHCQNLVLDADIPAGLAHTIINYYEELNSKELKYLNKKTSVYKAAGGKIKNLYNPELVAVRSSATAEDLPSASFAGQQETFLNVQGDAVLLTKIKECWASLFTARAIYYRHRQGFDKIKVGLAVVVQRMVHSEKSGIAFSLEPVTNDKTKIIIEAILGLGEYIVGGKVTPDHFEVDKRSFVILKKDISQQKVKLIKSHKNNAEVKLAQSEVGKQKISDHEIIKVALLVKEIENHYFFPQDIEWAIEGSKVFIVQSRPITTIKTLDNRSKDLDTSQAEGLKSNALMLTGSPASPGIATGPVKLIFSPKEIGLVKHGDILVAPLTNPDYVPAMKKAAAIVTDRGGRTSHAAIVSR